jgi:hypothetical protein
LFFGKKRNWETDKPWQTGSAPTGTRQTETATAGRGARLRGGRFRRLSAAHSRDWPTGALSAREPTRRATRASHTSPQPRNFASGAFRPVIARQPTAPRRRQTRSRRRQAPAAGPRRTRDRRALRCRRGRRLPPRESRDWPASTPPARESQHRAMWPGSHTSPCRGISPPASSPARSRAGPSRRATVERARGAGRGGWDPTNRNREWPPRMSAARWTKAGGARAPSGLVAVYFAGVATGLPFLM